MNGTVEAKPKRSQILIPVPMRPEFVDEISKALNRLGYSNRADFIRDAILEKLKNEGEEIDPAIAAA
ncbi:MAG: ribbon-helix-helix domain-containing protein, partial [Verrucomicrobia bacterium]|nr:ribbon-helix-helix domain-containing protein [Verrucomicrobiota bacterium]